MLKRIPDGIGTLVFFAAMFLFLIASVLLNGMRDGEKPTPVPVAPQLTPTPEPIWEIENDPLGGAPLVPTSTALGYVLNANGSWSPVDTIEGLNAAAEAGQHWLPANEWNAAQSGRPFLTPYPDEPEPGDDWEYHERGFPGGGI